MAIFDDLQYCKSSKRWVGLKKSKKKRDDVILEWSLRQKIAVFKAFKAFYLELRISNQS